MDGPALAVDPWVTSPGWGPVGIHLREGKLQSRPQRLSVRQVRHSGVRPRSVNADALSGDRGPSPLRLGPMVAAVAATLLLSVVVSSGPVMAQEDEAGMFDAISDLFSEPDNGTINVPKRRRQAPDSPAPTGNPGATVDAPDPPPPAAAPPRETVTVPKRRPSDPAAAPPPAAVSVPERPPPAPAMTVDAPDLPAPAPAPRAVSVPEGQPPASVPAPTVPGQAARPVERAEPAEDASPGHVFRATEDLIAEIQVLRTELAVSHFPPRAELIEGRAPVHVYVKSLEVLGKVIQLQLRMGLPPARRGFLPVKTIETADVLDHVEYILREVRSIKTQVVIDSPIESAPLRSGRTSSMNYRNLADASLMLDGLIGKTLTPADVYRNALFILDELELIAAMFGVSISFTLSPIEQEITPADVAAQILRATYKAINLQTRLQMESSQVPTMTLVRVSSSENYDAANLLLAEIARIKVHLGVTLTRADRPNLPRDQQSEDVFALVALIAGNIDTIAAAVGN